MKLLPKYLLASAILSSASLSAQEPFLNNSKHQSYSGEALSYIGMPVGGICAGQLYLGGDGQLWNWDIYNIPTSQPNGGGDRYYLNPMRVSEEFPNGFGLTITQGKKVYERRLNSSGFSDITFRGEYPVGKVNFKDNSLPVEVDLTAFSPFIPTDEDNSGLPATYLEYTVENLSVEPVFVKLSGWLQNLSGYTSGSSSTSQQHNVVERGEGFVRVSMGSDFMMKDSLADWGTLALTLLDANGEATSSANPVKGTGLYSVDANIVNSSAPLGDELVGAVERGVEIEAGQSHTFRFIISWHFPNVHLWKGDAHHWHEQQNLRHYYSSQFENADQVANYILSHPKLIENTLLWNKTWYDSSLPADFLDRTFLNASTLATTASFRFDDLTDNPINEGRYYNAEGVGLGHGTCTHVFHYEQALGRLFPAMARGLREQIDFGFAYGINGDDGVIGYRAETNYGSHDGRGYAVDGQAGTILRAYREHLMSGDDEFLKKNWKNIKGAMSYMIAQDAQKTGTADGILEGAQYNTLDRIWYGKITWISGLYAAALRASGEMAQRVGDKKFAKQCEIIAQRAYTNISEQLFNGEYFIQELDPEHLDAPNTNDGCHIDQLLGQYWASQLGLGNILPENEIKSALSSIMKYNYVENYDEFLKTTPIPIARWYGDGDESGVIMCSFPKSGADKAPGKINSEWEKLVVGYFSEMWTGQEHALAATLIDQDMVADALKIEEAINDRYSAEKRNPYNEIEYGNHYTRAMSGYAPFVSASGFYYDGPRGVIGFDPKISPENFRSAFVSAKGWGSYSQKIEGNKLLSTIELKYGTLALNQIQLPADFTSSKNLKASVNGVQAKIKDGAVILDQTIQLVAGDSLQLELKTL